MLPEIYSNVTRNFIKCMNLKKSNILSISKGIKSKNVDSTVSSNLCKCEIKRQRNEQLEFHSLLFHSALHFLLHLHKQILNISFSLVFLWSFQTLWNFRPHDSGYRAMSLFFRATWLSGDQTVNCMFCCEGQGIQAV